MFGGAAPDAMIPMVRLLASLHDDDGSVAVEGLTSYDGPVPERSDEELARTPPCCRASVRSAPVRSSAGCGSSRRSR